MPVRRGDLFVDRFDVVDRFDAQGRENVPGAGFERGSLSARRQTAQAIMDLADHHGAGQDAIGVLSDSGLDLGMVAHQVADCVRIQFGRLVQQDHTAADDASARFLNHGMLPVTAWGTSSDSTIAACRLTSRMAVHAETGYSGSCRFSTCA